MNKDRSSSYKAKESNSGQLKKCQFYEQSTYVNDKENLKKVRNATKYDSSSSRSSSNQVDSEEK
jgi:hypothetical protein